MFKYSLLIRHTKAASPTTIIIATASNMNKKNKNPLVGFDETILSQSFIELLYNCLGF